MRLTKTISENSSRSMSVRAQIVLGFGLTLILALIIAITGIINLRNLQDETDRALMSAGRIRELSLQIENEFLLARQSETDFMNTWRQLGASVAIDNYATVNATHMDQAHAGLDELESLIESSGETQLQPLLEKIDLLRPLLDTYDDAFQRAVDHISERSRASGVEATLSEDLDKLKNDVQDLPNSDLLRLVLEIQASERAFFGTAEQQYVDNVRLLSNQFVRLVEDTPPAELSNGETDLSAEDLVSQINAYQAAFRQLVDIENSIKISALTFREVTTDINALTSEIGDVGETTLEEAQARLSSISRRSGTALVASAVIALSFGATISYALGQQITQPLRRLSQAAEQIKQGNLRQQVQVSGGQELATLASSFNSMSVQLNQILGQLEQRVADRTRALETSTKVSRSLSTILDPDQLVSEVVELIGASFNYYHVHIYLLDITDQFLVMVGGTGEAGQVMLGRGHKIAKTQGLVGRAATTNEVVLVPDVSQEEGWLPNPLLPDTKAEVALPIAIGSQVLGVLDVQHNIINGLTDEDAQLLRSVSNQIAIGLRNARLYKQAHEKAEREAKIIKINNKIQNAQTIESVLQIAAEELGQSISAQRATVQLRANTESLNGGQ